jgi:1-deoxy-D-xylulose-5-phosphate reductoisomerase
MNAASPKKIVVLGATGSIGTQALDIVRKSRGTLLVAGLSAHSSRQKLTALAKEFSCANYALTKEGGADTLESLIERSNADIVINGISGAAGLRPSIWTLERGITLALANKETIVMAGSLVMRLAKEKNAPLIPVDSEHSALFQLFARIGKENIESVVLTASGGPFRERAKETFDSITADEALKHPTWNMGKKITIDSATLANKGLEVIEARYLFDIEAQKICVSIHPQSLVHSLVTARDGVLYAQISKPDMRHPILSALAYPAFEKNDFEKLDLAHGATNMNFCAPRWDDFPMLPLAFKAAKTGQAACIAYNAANEAAVDAFIEKKIKFTHFEKITSRVMEECGGQNIDSFADVFLLDAAARKMARQIIEQDIKETPK